MPETHFLSSWKGYLIIWPSSFLRCISNSSLYTKKGKNGGSYTCALSYIFIISSNNKKFLSFFIFLKFRTFWTDTQGRFNVNKTSATLLFKTLDLLNYLIHNPWETPSKKFRCAVVLSKEAEMMKWLHKLDPASALNCAVIILICHLDPVEMNDYRVSLPCPFSTQKNKKNNGTKKQLTKMFSSVSFNKYFWGWRCVPFLSSNNPL